MDCKPETYPRKSSESAITALPGLNTSYCQRSRFLWPFNATSKRWPRPQKHAAALGPSWCGSGSPNPTSDGQELGPKTRLGRSAASPRYIIITSFHNPALTLHHAVLLHHLDSPRVCGRQESYSYTDYVQVGLRLRGKCRDGCLGCKPTPAGLSPFSPAASELLQCGCLRRC